MISRKHHRFTVNLAAYFARDHRQKAKVTNLSMGGCQVQDVTTGVAMKGMLTLFVVVAAQEPPLRIDTAQVRWRSETAAGLKFILVERREISRLARYIAARDTSSTLLTPDEDTAWLSRAGLSDRIARKAYELFEARGKAAGYDLENWLEAERQVKAEIHLLANSSEGGQPRA